MRFPLSCSLLSLCLSLPGISAAPLDVGDLGNLGNLLQAAEHMTALKNRTAWCDPSDSLFLYSSAEKALQYSALAPRVEQYIINENKSSKRWLVNFIGWALKKDLEPTKASNCGKTIHTCDPGLADGSCTDYYDYVRPDSDEQDWPKVAYWVVKSVQGVHDKLTALKERLTVVTIAEGLNIKSMAEDFGASFQDDTVNSEELFSSIGAGIAIGGTLAGLIPGPGQVISTVAGVLGPLVDMFAPEAQEAREIPIADVQSAFSNRFRELNTGIDTVLTVAMGYSENEDDYSKLAVVKSGGLTRGVPNLLNNPLWLIDNNSNIISMLLDIAEEWMQKKLVESIVRSMGIEIIAKRKGLDGAANDKDECENSGNSGRRWIETQDVVGRTYEYCFELGYNNGDDEWDPVDPDSELYDKMDRYGINVLDQFYKSALECERARKRQGGRPDIGTKMEGLPLCFYSMPVNDWYQALHIYDGPSRYQPFFGQPGLGYLPPK